MCQNLFFNKVAGLRLWHSCFLVNLVRFLRIPFFTEHLWTTASIQTTKTKLCIDQKINKEVNVVDKNKRIIHMVHYHSSLTP